MVNIIRNTGCILDNNMNTTRHDRQSYTVITGMRDGHVHNRDSDMVPVNIH